MRAYPRAHSMKGRTREPPPSRAIRARAARERDGCHERHEARARSPNTRPRTHRARRSRRAARTPRRCASRLQQNLGGSKTRAAPHMVVRFAGMGLAEITIREIESACSECIGSVRVNAGERTTVEGSVGSTKTGFGNPNARKTLRRVHASTVYLEHRGLEPAFRSGTRARRRKRRLRPAVGATEARRAEDERACTFERAHLTGATSPRAMRRAFPLHRRRARSRPRRCGRPCTKPAIARRRGERRRFQSRCLANH